MMSEERRKASLIDCDRESRCQLSNLVVAETHAACTPRSLARRRTRVKIEESITQLLHSSIISSFRRSEFWLWDFLCGRRVQRGVGENSVGVGERDDGTHPFHEQAGFLSYLKWKEETEIEMYEGILQTGRLNGSTVEPACMVHPRIKDLCL